MASSERPRSPPGSPAQMKATPPLPSTITDGTVSSTLPAAEAFAVHYPGYPSSPARAAHSLGGLPAISKVRTSDPGSRLELRFRPEDPYCHPAFGEPRTSTGLVLRLSRPKGGGAPPRAEVVARVRNAYHFEGMADFQHVVPVHAAVARKRKRLECPNITEDLCSDKAGEMDDGDVMMLVPPLFSIKDSPTKIALLPSSNALSKSMQRGVVQHRWEVKICNFMITLTTSGVIPVISLKAGGSDLLPPMDIVPPFALRFNIHAVPKKINWEDHIPKNSAEWDRQMAVCKLFDERPVWPRQSLYDRLLDDGVQVSQFHFKRLLFRAGYYFSTGPFGKFWIRNGYDPRKDAESRIFQRIDFRMPPELRSFQWKKDCGSEKWSEMCKLERMPVKSFIFLQLFELKDDFIQAEISKPSHQSICSVHISIPQFYARQFLYFCFYVHATSSEAPAKHAGSEDQLDPNNSGSENVDEEEEEEEEHKEESDGYESPPMAEDDRDFTLHDSFGEGFSTGYLEEVLRSFPLNEDEHNKLGHALNNAEASDGEFEIFEQPSDVEDYSDG